MNGTAWWTAAVALTLGTAAPVAAQSSGGFPAPTPQQLSRQPSTATQSPGTGSTSTNSTGTTDQTQLTGVWAEIAMLADDLAAEFDLQFNDPWEEFFFFMMVARMYFWVNGFPEHTGGAPTGNSTTSPPTTTTPSSTSGTTPPRTTNSGGSR